jgi:hypothetical protein
VLFTFFIANRPTRVSQENQKRRRNVRVEIPTPSPSPFFTAVHDFVCRRYDRSLLLFNTPQRNRSRIRLRRSFADNEYCVYKQNGTTELGDLTYKYDKAGSRSEIGGSFARTVSISANTVALVISRLGD